jgi:hypothetical protein
MQMKKLQVGVVHKWCRRGLVVGAVMLAGGMSLRAQDPDQITAKDVASYRLKYTKVNPKAAGETGTEQATLPGLGANIGVDTVVNFSGAYSTQGVDASGKPNSTWLFNTLGKKPSDGGTTTIGAPIVPVALDFRNKDGSPRYVKMVNGKAHTCGTASEPGCKRLYFDPTPFIEPVLESPVYSNFNYDSSAAPTQFADAVSKAEYQGAPQSWHTLLAPSVKTKRTMVINQGQTCGVGLAKGTHCNYFFALKPDGTCCSFVLLNANVFQNEFFPTSNTFPPDSSTPIGAAEAAGEITTKDVSSFFFPPAYLFVPVKNGTECCIGGFHSLDFESGDAKNGGLLRLFVVAFVTWDQPIFVDPETLDVTGYSHEISEVYNDPLVVVDGVHDLTPWWLAPNGNCQDDLEVGDVVEGLPNESFPITMPNGVTYHPQNEALLQWFEFQSPSTALHGAYSYPDVTTLTKLSAPQNANCAP